MNIMERGQVLPVPVPVLDSIQRSDGSNFNCKKETYTKDSNHLRAQKCPEINTSCTNHNFSKKTLTTHTVNPCILSFKQLEYAVRGPVICRSFEIEKDLSRGVNKPFNEVIKANVGDAQAMGQKPITFLRQVLALVVCPELIEQSTFPSDVKKKANEILKGCRGGSAGSYTDSRGLEIIREHVAAYIERRDAGIGANGENIILVAGASDGIRACLKLFKYVDENGKKSGVLTPVPQYPLYAATLGEYDMAAIDYYLDESRGWTLSVTELKRAIDEARLTCHPRALVVINPGNPTGNVLTRKNMEEIIKFAWEEELFLLADEVYQDNIYEGSEFLSFKRVMVEMGSPFNSMELVSFFSCSKGFAGECGLRGGYCEIFNMDPAVQRVLTTSIIAKLCPTVLGQAAVDCIVDPPQSFQPSYTLFQTEKREILGSLAEKADLVFTSLKGLFGVECQPIQGAMYAFPKIILPVKAVETAIELKMEPDEFYAIELLEETGISVVPGSGMGQATGTYHFRTTLLPSMDKLKMMMTKFQKFHINFMNRYT